MFPMTYEVGTPGVASLDHGYLAEWAHHILLSGLVYPTHQEDPQLYGLLETCDIFG